MPQTSHSPFFVKSQFYNSISDFFCHQKVKSVFSKHQTFIRFFDTKKNAPIRDLKSTFFVKNQQKSNLHLYIGPFFSSNFLGFSPNHNLKSALFF